jgi:flagellar basal body P-ring formation protein FlgA
VTAGELDSRLRLAQCAEPLRAMQVSGSRMQARMPIGVSCRRGAEWTIYVPVTVESEIPVLVLRTPVVRGARINEGDVAVETRRVSGFPVGYVTDARALERHTAARPLPAGTVLTADTITPDFIVRSGEQVTLLASAGGIEVHAAGKALADGHEGSRIRVQNLNSLKIVEGVVDRDRVIRVTP